uniref:hypothetical protein n=1 Tax=Blautia sp. TaxID=1955243 RepID=UPI003FF13FDC
RCLPFWQTDRRYSSREASLRVPPFLTYRKYYNKKQGKRETFLYGMEKNKKIKKKILKNRRKSGIIKQNV